MSVIRRHIIPGGTPVVEYVDDRAVLTLHHAQAGDGNVVLSTGTKPSVVAAMPPAEARLFALAILNAADEIDWSGSPDREFDRIFNDPSARGRFKEGMSIARSVLRGSR